MSLKLQPLDARIPKWDFVDLFDRACPICDTPKQEIKFERPDGLKVRHCDTCHAYFVSPSPSEDQLRRFYESYDEKHRRESKISSKELASAYREIDPLSDTRIKELSSYIELRNARVLDVGFGRPYFLFALKQLGAIPYGLELDARAIEYAKALGIDNVVLKTLSDYVSETKFDLIIMMDLIEHPLNPLELLWKAVALLQPGGLLLIWTPNGDSLGRDKELIALRVDLEHMQYFTADCCSFLATKLNCHIVHMETLGFPNLKDIEKLPSQAEGMSDRVKKLIKRSPGFSIANKVRRRFLAKGPDERTGAYHLFTILQKNS
jgi:2-polyprenyl-3-methyl-5-hydroxy-6-metoxy-1,4-benzoquinol methylase